MLSNLQSANARETHVTLLKGQERILTRFIFFQTIRREESAPTWTVLGRVQTRWWGGPQCCPLTTTREFEVLATEQTDLKFSLTLMH